MSFLLTETQQSVLIYYYQTHSYSIPELAKRFQVSERTVRRIIKRAGLELPREAKMSTEKKEQRACMKLLKEYQMTSSRLRTLLIQDKEARKSRPILTTAQMLLPFNFDSPPTTSQSPGE